MTKVQSLASKITPELFTAYELLKAIDASQDDYAKIKAAEARKCLRRISDTLKEAITPKA